MSRFLSFFKRIRIGQFLTTFIVGVALFLTTACNSGTVQGARPSNPPVQMGGNNNPHTMGGDGLTDYQMSTDPSVKNKPTNVDRNHAAAFGFNQLIADNSRVTTNSDTLLYPGDETKNDANPTVGQVNPRVFDEQAGEIPAQRQPVIDRSDPDVNILEKVGEAFKEGSSFIKDYVDEGAEAALKTEEARK